MRKVGRENKQGSGSPVWRRASEKARGRRPQQWEGRRPRQELSMVPADLRLQVCDLTCLHRARTHTRAQGRRTALKTAAMLGNHFYGEDKKKRERDHPLPGFRFSEAAPWEGHPGHMQGPHLPKNIPGAAEGTGSKAQPA